MKRLTLLTLIALIVCTTVQAKTDNWGDFYAYLAQKIEYPTAAKLQNHQGNSIITFSVTQGDLKNVNVQTELGKGCDVAILNSLMAYPQLKTIKEGKYALKVSFRLQGANSTIINEFAKMPVGFTALNTVHIATSIPVTAQQKNTALNNESSLVVRGYGSVKAPMYVLDGKVSDVSISELDANQIESLSILKNASALSLYGPEAQNGVIVITTKKPITTETSVVAGNETGITLRGTNVIGKTPMYILDGEPVTNTEIIGLDPNKIQSIQILKDASALTLYGPAALGGVVIFTTKKDTAVQKTKK